jgi:hypothetical protein
MKRARTLTGFLCACAVCIPSAACAYFLPLVGAGSVIVTMLIGLGAVLISAVYLIFFKTRRMLRRWRASGRKDTPGGDSQSPSDRPS